jgi:hypothetical protein
MSLSGGVKALSWVVALLLCAIPLLAWSILPGAAVGGPRGPGGPGVEIARWASLLAPLTALGSWMLAPRGLEIGGGELRLLRRAWRAAAYRLSSVEEVALLPPGAMRGAVRTLGNGGLFGYYGWFFKSGRGAFRLFATRSDGLVEVVAGGRRLVLSPDEPGRFVEDLLATAPRAAMPRQGLGPGAATAMRRS